MTLSKDDELLLNAFLDGELDSLEASRFEARLASEPALAADIEADDRGPRALDDRDHRARVRVEQLAVVGRILRHAVARHGPPYIGR